MAASAGTDTQSSRFKIYTGTGDKGQASLFNGQRAFKNSEVFEALGNVDELNSALGIAKEFCRGTHPGLVEQLDEVQSRLIDVGASVATPPATSSENKLKRAAFNGDDHVKTVEGWIDAMDEQLAPLRNFILPGGGKAAAFLHQARSVCRRAERSVVALLRESHAEESVCAYLNRLSDYLFTAARFAAMQEGEPEQVYKKPHN